MSSTRNNNTPGDYALQQWSLTQQFQNALYPNAANGQAFTRNLAGNGLLVGRMAGRDLANNSCDIESELFGIGSTNLVQPLAKVQPDFIPLKSLNVFEKPGVYMPKDLFVEANQRALPLN
jgi:hypothetical protein